MLRGQSIECMKWDAGAMVTTMVMLMVGDVNGNDDVISMAMKLKRL